jgi:hypothetical protein
LTINPEGGVVPLKVYGMIACASAAPPELFKGVTISEGSDSIECVTVKNCGEVLSEYLVKISGTDAADYTVVSVGNSPTLPDSTFQICIKFHPETAGPTSAMLDIAEAIVQTIHIPPSGSGGCAVITTTVDSIPPTGKGQTSTFTITIHNSGNYPADVGTTFLTGCTTFHISSMTPAIIHPDSNTVVTIQFSPSDLHDCDAMLSFPDAGPCEDKAVSISLYGKTTVNVVKGETGDGFSLDQTFPNPTTGAASFTYTTPKESEIRIMLSDITGKVVRTIIRGRVSEGEHLVNFNVSDIPSGSYILSLQSTKTRLTRELILTK